MDAVLDLQSLETNEPPSGGHGGGGGGGGGGSTSSLSLLGVCSNSYLSVVIC